jgi:hypothetical protein
MNGTATAPPIGEASSAMLPRFQLSVGQDVPCNSVVTLRVRETTEQGPSFEQAIELPVGTRVERVDVMEEDVDWNINPDGTDTASTARNGAWELGAPNFTSLLGEILQPREDHTPGAAKLAFTTGVATFGQPARGDVDRGKTTLESPVFALRDLRDPQLVFYVWHVARDFTKDPPVDVPSAALIIKGTDDGGETWNEMARIEQNTTEWTRIGLRIRDQLELTNKVRFRFEIEEMAMGSIRSSKRRSTISPSSITSRSAICRTTAMPAWKTPAVAAT